MRILISGAGIAGPTLAYWLAHFGLTPTFVERAPHLRTGGYIIDFWGAGFEIAARMGLLPEVSEKGYRVREVRVVNHDGERVAGFHTTAFARATGGRFLSLPRGDLAAAIFERIEGTVDTIFHDSVVSVEQAGAGVHRRRGVCVSLLGGEGSGLAMVAAYILAGELCRANGATSRRSPDTRRSSRRSRRTSKKPHDTGPEHSRRVPPLACSFTITSSISWRSRGLHASHSVAASRTTHCCQRTDPNRYVMLAA